MKRENIDADTTQEEQIRPSALMKDKEDSLNADVAFLIERKSEWVSVACPSCGISTSTHFGNKQGFSFDLCETCGTVYTNPRPSLGLLHQFYETSLNYKFWNDHIFPATEKVRRERIFRPRVERVLSSLRLRGIEDFSLVEVGAAYGWFCEEMILANPQAKVIAVEPSSSLAETCRNKGIETKNVPIESLELPEQIDAVAAFEVIEHIFSPADFIGHLNRILKPGGTAFLSCPNLHGFDVEMLGLGSSTFQHEHLNYFTPSSIARLLETHGFTDVQVSTPGELDVDIVRQNIDDFRRGPSQDKFVQQILDANDPKLDRAFQRFLAENCLSSHMWVMARKIS